MVAVSRVPSRTHAATPVDRVSPAPARRVPIWLPGEREAAVEVLIARDGLSCHYCGRVIGTRRWCATVDHLWPRSFGGPNRTWNLVLACSPCNSARGNSIDWCRCARCVVAFHLGSLVAGSAGWAAERAS